MEDGEKLRQDLVILEAMAYDMDDYLRSDVMFWPMQRGDLPRLTLGGYLMRQHRLFALRELLDAEEQARLAEAVELFKSALVEKVVRFEARANDELEMRLRQWEQYLNNVTGDAGSSAYYAASVETRAMIEALLQQLQVAPYRLRERLAERTQLLDNYLRRTWHAGDFVWPEAWQPAYPRDQYWWLYGMPG